MKNKLPDMKTAFTNFTPEALYVKGAEKVADAKDNFKGSLFGKVDEGTTSDKSLADELFQWATNESAWYRKWATPIITNLKKHLVKDKYNTAQAVKLWNKASNAAADMYAKTFGETGAKGKDMFPPKILKMVAVAMEDTYQEEVGVS